MQDNFSIDPNMKFLKNLESKFLEIKSKHRENISFMHTFIKHTHLMQGRVNQFLD